MSGSDEVGRPDGTAEDASTTPLLRVVKGDPTPEQLAALVGVVAALGSAQQPPARRPVQHWSAPARRLRRPLHAGPGAWRASALPS